MEKITNDEKKDILKKYNVSPDEKILLFTGRIVPEKGVKELVEALKSVKYKNFKLFILGSALNELSAKTDYQIEVEQLVNDLNEKVIFTGFVNYNEIYKFYSIADIAVLPSVWNDPAPLTIIESLVSGLPIITTNSGGIPEYATNGSAVIIPRDSNIINNLAIKIDELLSDENKLLEMSKSGKEVSIDLTLNNYYNNFYSNF